MKMLFLGIPSIFFMKYMYINIIMLMPLMLLLLFNMNYKMMIPNQLCLLDQLSSMMITLSLISTMLIILSSNNFKNIILMIFPIFITLIFTFSMHNMFFFYISFELILIPTMLLITKSGMQPERLQAGVYLLFYTILASLPLLISIILLKNNPSFTILYINLLKLKFIMFLTLAFLVKMPMFFTHLWLPKAHVEAPLEGSMILAAILLKLGGYGLIRMFPMCINKLFQMNSWLISISILGSIATSMNCIRQKDLKSLIAYSSVAHMALVLASIFSLNKIGMTGAIFMMIAHGLSSSALFLLVNDIYMKMHSRNIILFKGLISIMPNMSFWWFMFMAINISAPPTINTISEIFIMSSLISWTKLTMTPIMLSSFMAASFSLIMFININHNKNLMMPFNFSNQKTFLSLFTHTTPLIILLMKMEMLFL